MSSFDGSFNIQSKDVKMKLEIIQKTKSKSTSNEI